MRRRPQRESRGQSPGEHRAKTAKQRRRQHQQQRHGGAAQGDVDGGKHHPIGSVRTVIRALSI
jgi:hypothetical protein